MLSNGEREGVLCEEGNGRLRVRWWANMLASNRPCEDRWAVHAINTGSTREVLGVKRLSFWPAWAQLSSHNTQNDTRDSKDLLFATVLDGHGSNGGWEVAELLRKTLHASLALALVPLMGDRGIVDTEQACSTISRT
jgi:hypothetical protein